MIWLPDSQDLFHCLWVVWWTCYFPYDVNKQCQGLPQVARGLQVSRGGWSCRSLWWLGFMGLAGFSWKNDQWQPYGREYYPTLPPQWDLKMGRFNIPGFYVDMYCQHLSSSANPVSRQLQLSRMHASSICIWGLFPSKSALSRVSQRHLAPLECHSHVIQK